MNGSASHQLPISCLSGLLANQRRSSARRASASINACPRAVFTPRNTLPSVSRHGCFAITLSVLLARDVQVRTCGCADAETLGSPRNAGVAANPHIRISARWLLNVLRWLTLFDGFCACRVDFRLKK